MASELRTAEAAVLSRHRTGRRGDARIVLVGTLGALALGIIARLWMRLIAPEPDFTWSGTIFIVAGFTVFGLATWPERRRES